MTDFLINNVDEGESYLPEDYQEKPLCRQWLINLCTEFSKHFIGNSLNQDEFNEYVTSAIKSREEQIIAENKIEVSLGNRVYDALKSSNLVSSKLINL